MSSLNPASDWLTLKKAAEFLAVHPTTIRRWADNGEIPVLRTPGGHRRFLVSDLKKFALTQQQNRKTAPVAEVWAEKSLQRTRQNIPTQSAASWMIQVNEEQRLQHRQLGRQLMGLTLQFINSGEDEELLLTEAHRLGKAYGQLVRQSGTSLTQAIEAAMFFRDQLLEVALQLPESTQIKPEANVRLTRRINRLMNTVQLAIASVYEQS